ncbi:hypothetical protein ACJX0J_035156, partial [Zea mays]
DKLLDWVAMIGTRLQYLCLFGFLKKTRMILFVKEWLNYDTRFRLFMNIIFIFLFIFWYTGSIEERSSNMVMQVKLIFPYIRTKTYKIVCCIGLMIMHDNYD